jgi:hypothetical protein
MFKTRVVAKKAKGKVKGDATLRKRVSADDADATEPVPAAGARA